MKRPLVAFAFSLIVSCGVFIESSGSNFDPLNWTQTPATPRDVLDVQVLDYNTVIAVGGRESNDAITSIFRTDDRGENWAIILDVPYSPWLKAVHFPSTTTGFAAGYDGMVLRTVDAGNTWDTITLAGNAALRDYNDVYFVSEDIGFLVGGNQTNDSIQTILKTVDGGDNWQIVNDNLGHWLNAVQFVSSSVGFASGESGTILKTTDGGDSWSPVTLTGTTANRHYNDIKFLDEMIGIAIGGNEKNDSIRTILKTTDGGTNWTVILDGIGSWLNGIDFLPAGNMVAVGNDSTILSSADAGNTWEKVMIPTIINPPVHLNAVSFIHDSLGVVVGNQGQILFYEGTLPLLPSVTINPAIISTSDSIWVSGTVAANGSDTDVFFDYGPTTSLGFTINATPSLVLASDSTYVEAVFSGIPEGIYYYQLRAENQRGEVLSEMRQFYIGNFYEDVNLDFEYWDEQTVNLPIVWSVFGTISQSPSYDGSIAATLSSVGQDSITDMLIGNVNDDQFIGGLPVSSKPDSVVGYFNYDITPGSEGIVFIALKKDGALLTHEVYPFTGSSNGLFERLSFPVAYSGIETPDTLVLGMSTGNSFEEPEVLSLDNVITVDDLQVISSSPTTIPNGDFEQWHDVVFSSPSGWYSLDLMHEPLLNTTVFRTQDAQYGNYAVTLQNRIDYNATGFLTTTKSENDLEPSFPVAGKHATFNGYYKYNMLGIQDTVDISINLFQGGLPVGLGFIQFEETVTSYSPFEVALTYDSPTSMPDSASISIKIGGLYQGPPGNSTLYIDNLSFDGFVIPYQPSIITSLDEPTDPAASVLVYPNPSNGNITLEFNQDVGVFRALVYNSNGALVFEKSGAESSNKLNLDMAKQTPGIYFLQLHHHGSDVPITQKLIIQ